MNLVFLGGAESIGASCALLEIDDQRWIIDCGVRMSGKEADRLPELSHVETGGPPTAVLITHAHLDHIGALPVLHQRFPLTPVYATPPTIDLTRVQLLDSLKIMEEEAKFEGELPLYSEATVNSLLTNMVPVKPLRAFRPDPSGPEVTFFPAGHILGACALGVEGKEARIFFSGDVSVDNQRTIPGMRAPRFRADVAVFESTYGNRLHPRRAAEEERLVETVAATIARGGKVLVPAFAIGRAQEVILILLRAQLLKQIPPFPIFVDGMVRRVCNVYASHSWFLQSTLRRRIEKHGDPFFAVVDNVQPVRKPAQRAEIIAGGPAVVVSSSGMLTGGPSPVYARAFASDPKNLISITGYQDEEAPGRRLLDVARGRTETIVLDGSEVRPEAKIATYALSGHASGAQIAALARALCPADVFLVHGDSAARRDLADFFVRERIGRVHLPGHGETYVPAGRRSARQGSPERTDLRRLRVTGIGKTQSGDPLSDDDFESLAASLRDTYGESSCFTADELYVVWYGHEAADPESAENFEAAIRASRHFSLHPSRLFHFVPAPLPEPSGEGEPPVNLVLERLEEGLPPHADLLKKSYQPGTRHMVLAFAFPDVAAEKYGRLLEDIFRDTGWSYEIHPHPNLASLDGAIRELVPEERLLAKNPSVHADERAVMLYLRRPLEPEEDEAWNVAAAQIYECTGFRITSTVRGETAPAREARDAEGRLEINLAYRAIKEAFEDEPHRPYRTGKKTGRLGEPPYIELSFISPQVGSRYADKLARLSAEIAWELRVAQIPNQNAILDTARHLCQPHGLRGGPSFLPQEETVAVRWDNPPSPEEREALAARFLELTGFRLVDKT